MLNQPKCQLNLLKAIEKGKKAISADDEVIIEAEGLVDDEDYIYELKREEFDDVIRPLAE